MKKAIVAVCLMIGLPLAGFANVVVTAQAQNGGTAILYNPANGNIFDTATFAGGHATLSTASLSFAQKYAVTMTYGSSPRWRSDIYWAAGAGVVSGTKAYGGPADVYVTALTGSIKARSFDTTPGNRSVSVTMASSGKVRLYNNDSFALDANLLVYKPAATLGEMTAGATITKTWDSGTLLGSYGFTTTGIGSGVEKITMTKNGGFYADFLGLNQGGGVYDLYFASAFDPGGSSYDTGTVVDDGDDVKFTSAIASTEALETFTPYYAMMESAWMYDLDDNYSLMPSDDGLVLTNPDYYAIPEPAVILMMLGGGGGLLFVRRFFMI